MKTGFKKFPAPFSVERPRSKRQRGNLILTNNSSLEQRRSYLEAQMAAFFPKADLVGPLYSTFFKVALKNFSIFGKSLVFAIFLDGETSGFTVTVPEQNLSILKIGSEKVRFFEGAIPESPYQSELVQETIDSKTPALSQTQQGSFLALPLLDPKSQELLGILLFSNLLSREKKDFTKADVEVATIFAEHAARAVRKFRPDAQAEILRKLPSGQLVEELLARMLWWVIRRRKPSEPPQIK